MPSRKELLARLEALGHVTSGMAKDIIIGIVHPEHGLTHSLTTKDFKTFTKTDKEPTCYLPAKLEKVLTAKQRFIVIIGGRGSGKSIGAGADIPLLDAYLTGSKTFCLREHYTSIKDSTYSLLKEEIARLDLDGFDIQARSIRRAGHDCFSFAGISRNPESIKSSYGFQRYCVEEAQFITEESLTLLTPSARNKPKSGLPGDTQEDGKEQRQAQLMFIANPGSREDPFSKRFIVPFLSDLESNGEYEDDMHLIIKMNYSDNPWFAESGLEQERRLDLSMKDDALYRHIWEGDFYDGVENALILRQWFDACIDAHIKLGFEPVGARVAAFDPSDTGGDSKAYALRHGSVVLDIREKKDGDIVEGAKWAAQMAIDDDVDYFTWDSDGIHSALDDTIGRVMQGRHTRLITFKGSHSPEAPDAAYRPVRYGSIRDGLKVKDVVRNKRAQMYLRLTDRIYRTYRAVVFREYIDPDELISFSSDMQELCRLRTELCRIPVKPPNRNGRIEMYTKREMREDFKIASPNLADALMMLESYTPPRMQLKKIRPRPMTIKRSRPRL